VSHGANAGQNDLVWFSGQLLIFGTIVAEKIFWERVSSWTSAACSGLYIYLWVTRSIGGAPQNKKAALAFIVHVKPRGVDGTLLALRGRLFSCLV
jgi:hypothetical protein